MELGMRSCPKPDCNGKVELEARGEMDLLEATGRGRCDKCGQQYEVELIIEAAEELLPVDSV